MNAAADRPDLPPGHPPDHPGTPAETAGAPPPHAQDRPESGKPDPQPSGLAEAPGPSAAGTAAREKARPAGPGAPHADPLLRAVERDSARQARWLREGEASVARRLAQIGVLGWIVVSPMLGGIFLGRWLDHRLGSGLFWTAPLLLLGLVIGGRLGWKWVNSQ